MWIDLFDSVESLCEVSNDVIDIFQTDRQTDHAGIDARGDQLLIGELTVRFRSRMQDAGADIRNVNNI